MLNTFRTRQAIEELNAITRRYHSIREGSRKTTSSPTRHKVFVSYHAEDAVEVLEFINSNTDVFIPRAIGMDEEGSDIIDSNDVGYIRQTIREKYLKDSTVTLLAIGECTWARKFVDWEIYTSLRYDPEPNGLLAVQLPSVANIKPKLPERLLKNLANGDGSSGYAEYYIPPPSRADLRSWIDTAYQKRETHAGFIELGGALRERNSSC